MTAIRSLIQGRSRYLLVLIILAGVGAAFWAGADRLKVDTDITSALPGNDPLINAARQILKRHPVLENVFIQISMSGTAGGTEALIEAGDYVSEALQKSGLVKVMSGKEGAVYFASLLESVTDNLPLLFSREELNGQVQTLIQPDEIKKCIQDQFRRLSDVASIGQTELIAKDPLGFRNLVLGRLASGFPVNGAIVRNGHITTKSGRHLLIIAEPRQFSKDPSFARRMTETLKEISRKFEALSVPGERSFKMVYAGAFRASLDNERIIKRDTSRALILVTIGLIPLAILSFRRVWLGILSFVPAVAGTMLAVFVYALTNDSIFAITMGFGGALIGIAVDHGMAYVILLDRPFETRGWKVAREVWSVSSMTVISTIVALLSLAATGIPLFTQLGIFSALGVGLSALFVHIFFPLLFPRLKGSRKEKRIWMERLMDGLVSRASWRTFAAFVLFTVVMAFFAKPHFSVNLESMNTISKETMEAEQTIETTWGAFQRKPCIMIKGETLERLWQEADRLAEFLRREKAASVLGDAIPRAAVLPGPSSQESNLAAWREFWNSNRVSALQASLRADGERMGFKPDAFAPFLKNLEHPQPSRILIPSELFPFFGIFPEGESNQGWVWAEVISPGPNYQAESFFRRAAAEGFLSFDAGHFSRHLTRELNRSFVWMLLMVGGVTFGILFFYFLDWQILLLAIAPVSFSVVATLGTMGLLNRPLSIPSLMLAPLIIGLGLEQGLYLVRSFQRYGSAPDPNSDAFRVTILVCSITTLIGFASLLFSEHVVLRDAGVSTFLGIFYATAGAFGILPPLLRLIFRDRATLAAPAPLGSPQHVKAALRRYRHLEPYPRLFARFKMLLDPMFPRLAEFIRPTGKIIDVGCGYAVPAAWLLAAYPGLGFLACEPDGERARVAARVLGKSGHVFPCPALDLPLPNEKADAVLLLDVIHYFSDSELRKLLTKMRPVIGVGGKFIIRVTIPGAGFRVFRSMEELKLRCRGVRYYFRSAGQIIRILNEANFRLDVAEPSAPGREETWFVARIREDPLRQAQDQ